MQTQDKVQFWNDKILGWEQSRYAGNASGEAVLEKLVKGGGGSVRNRLQIAANILRPHLRGKTLLDVGCGSGLLFQCLAGNGAARFVGVDLAPAAVEQAKKIASRTLLEPTTFLAGSVTDLRLPNFEIVSALGVLDWLTDDEMDRFFARIRGKRFLLSISERRRSLSQLLHRLYVFVAYGWRSRAYTPRYDDTASIIARLEAHDFADIHVVRDCRLSFGVLLHNLPPA
jgi:2-polyprenyl-3-methyl-5-hydroxy-6-metoxy-1,4-benzoquinol methylase